MGCSACRHIWIFGAAACCLAVAGAAPTIPIPDTDRDAKVLYSSVRRGAQDPRPGGRLWRGRACHHRQRLRHAARVPLPGAALPVDSGPRRGRAGEPEHCPKGGRPIASRSGPGVLFHTDPCFTLSQSGRQTREVVAADAAFALARVADPAVNSPAHQQLCADRRACPTSASA